MNEPKAVFSTLTAKFEGKRYNSPNDIAIRSNGDLYFTDPPYGLEHGVDDPAREMQTQGVYRLATDGTATLLTDELSRPNGIVFSPDERILYVANSDVRQPVIMAYTLQKNGGFADSRVFYNSWGDGMAVDQDGNVYVAGPRREVLVIASDGTHLGSLVTTEKTSNCTFGDDGSTLYITSDMYLLRIRLLARGMGF